MKEFILGFWMAGWLWAVVLVFRVNRGEALWWKAAQSLYMLTWWPAELFMFTPGEERKSMEPYQEIVIAEKAELDERHARLIEFGMNDKLLSVLPVEEQERLKRQSRIMDEYSRVLGERIAAFTAKE